jgi:hypothetical protein
MLERLTLKNWQCHQEFDVELAPVTVFTGDNASGKSSILRGLRWLALDEWDGKAGEYISWDKTGCAVRLAGEGHTVQRSRSGEGNRYLFDGEELKAWKGPGPPKSVQDWLRLGEANFQLQQALPFWLSLTPGQAASALNLIFHLTEIDEAHLRAGREVTRARACVDLGDRHLQDARKLVDDLAGVPAADLALREVEALEDQVPVLEEEIAALEDDLRWLEYDEGTLTYLQQVEAALVEVLKHCDACAEVEAQIEGVAVCLATAAAVDLWTKDVKALETELSELLRGTCPLCGRREEE